jgi:hypothetical protein
MAQAIADQLREAGAAEPELPSPEAWRGRVVWARLFDEAGRSAVAGVLAPAEAEAPELRNP